MYIKYCFPSTFCWLRFGRVNLEMTVDSKAVAGLKFEQNGDRVLWSVRREEGVEYFGKNVKLVTGLVSEGRCIVQSSDKCVAYNLKKQLVFICRRVLTFFATPSQSQAKQRWTASTRHRECMRSITSSVCSFLLEVITTGDSCCQMAIWKYRSQCQH